MLSKANAIKVMLIANNAKIHGDFETAVLAFFGLMILKFQGKVKGVRFEYHMEEDKESKFCHPYYDLLVIVIDEHILTLPRPKIHVQAFSKFREMATDEDRREEYPEDNTKNFVSFASVLKQYNLPFIPQLRLGERVSHKLWMLAEEITEFGLPA